jgi:hypothetical protein
VSSQSPKVVFLSEAGFISMEEIQQVLEALVKPTVQLQMVTEL